MNNDFEISKITVTFNVASVSASNTHTLTLWTEIAKVLDQQNFIWKDLLVNKEIKNEQ